MKELTETDFDRIQTSIKFIWALSRYTRGSILATTDNELPQPSLLEVKMDGVWNPLHMDSYEPEHIFLECAQRLKTNPQTACMVWTIGTRLAFDMPGKNVPVSKECWMLLVLTPSGMGPSVVCSEKHCVNIFENSPVDISNMKDLLKYMEDDNLEKVFANYLSEVTKNIHPEFLENTILNDDLFYLLPDNWGTVDGVEQAKFNYYLSMFDGVIGES